VIDEVNVFIQGWTAYFRYAACKSHLRDMDQWLRHRLRCLRLKQCKGTKTMADLLHRLGVPKWRAWIGALSGKGWWRLSDSPPMHEAMSLAWFQKLGLISLEARYVMLKNQ
jgi:RNA-directed DNA polymerase